MPRTAESKYLDQCLGTGLLSKVNMRFGRRLRLSVYEPWQRHYLDYAKLKRLLREDELDNGDITTSVDEQTRLWTEEDEGTFVEELLNVQLEKVNAFHTETIEQFRERTSECETKLENYLKSLEADGDLRDQRQMDETLELVGRGG